MKDISDLSGAGLPSTQSLVKATIVALIAALVVLAVAVLPAEYGVDPTGLGKRLGLAAMSTSAADTPEAVAADTLEPTSSGATVSVLDAVWKSDADYRTDELTVELGPREGVEVKAAMQPNDRFVFSWETQGGAVFFDMHGEEANATNGEFTSYWKGRDQSSSRGSFTAPFAGTHGWYWENRGDEPVTVRVKTSGYYEKLYRPQ